MMMCKRSVLALALCVVASASAPEFVVDLDLKPEDRWREVYQYYLGSGLLRSMATNSLPASNSLLQSMTTLRPASKSNVSDPDDWATVTNAQISEEYFREAVGIAQLVKESDPIFDYVTPQMVVSFGNGYEAAHSGFCSGLIATMSNGTVVHGRNMDIPPSRFIHEGRECDLSDVTVNVLFKKGGQPLFTSVHWPYQIGVHTGMRFDGWSFEQNTRRSGNDAELNLAAAQNGGLVFMYYARRVLEETPDFEGAVQSFYNAKFAATQYFILAGKGPNEGAVLSIDRMGQHLPDSPPLRRLSQENWHIIQTNDDIGSRPHDKRRPAEELRLVVSSQNQVSPAWSLQEMSSHAISNDMTVFHWIAVPEMNYYRLVLPREEASDLPALAPPADMQSKKIALIERSRSQSFLRKHRYAA